MASRPPSRGWSRPARAVLRAVLARGGEGRRGPGSRDLGPLRLPGRRVEWSPLTDGDELVIGRHALYFLDTVAEPAAAAPAALAE